MATRLFGNAKAGITSVSKPALLLKVSDNTADTGKVAANLSAYYYRQGAAATVPVTLTDLAGLNSAYASGGVKEVADGLYRVDWPDAAFAANADYVVLVLKEGANATYMEEVALEAHGADDCYNGVTVAGYATGQDPATLVWGATVRTLSAFAFQVTVATNNDKAGYSLLTSPPSASTIAAMVVPEVAAAILADPTHLLVTDAAGRVTVGASNDKTGYSLASAPPTASAIATACASSILASPANLLATDGTGRVTVGTVADKAGYALAASGLDAVMITASLNARRAINAILALLGGRLSGVPAAGQAGTVLVRDIDNAVNVATIGVDGNGNRTSSSITPPT